MIFFLFLLLFSFGCGNQTQKQEEYQKCTAVCAAVLDDDFVTLELCRQECSEKFLEK
jgi:hypothetical protein